MTFLHTIFLTALAAAAIPIILHFFSRQRLPLIEFSSLRFLKLLQKKKSRRIQIRQIILLIIRALAVAAVVMVFARPALKSDAAGGSASSVEIVVILDDALTSMVETRDGQLLKQSVRYALELVEMVESNDLITVIPTATPDKFTFSQYGQKELTRSYLRELTPKPFSPKLDRAVAIADSILMNSERFNQELYVIGGLYDSMFEALKRDSISERVRTFVIPIGPDEMDNVTVESANVTNSILQKGEPVELEVTVANHSDSPITESLVSVYLNRDRVSQSLVNLPANGKTVHTLSVIPEKSGFNGGWVKYEDADVLSMDNRRYFVLSIPDTVRLLAVTPDKKTQLIISSIFQGDKLRSIAVDFGDAAGWETTSLSSYDVILLAGLDHVSSGAAQRVAEFARHGGGVIMIPSSDSDLANLNRGVWKSLGYAGAKETQTHGGIGWGKLDLTHPLFSGMFEEKGAPKSPTFKFTLDLATRGDDRVIIPLADGRPFLIERQVESGRALLFASTLSPETGDMIFSGIFAPLMHRCVRYVTSNNGSDNRSIEAGGYHQTVINGGNSGSLQLVSPEGDVTNVVPRPVLGGAEYRLGPFESIGVYDLDVEDRTVARFASNVRTDYSSLSRSGNRESGVLLGAVEIGGDPVTISQEILARRYGRELWQPIAAIFMLLLMSESVIGRAARRREE